MNDIVEQGQAKLEDLKAQSQEVLQKTADQMSSAADTLLDKADEATNKIPGTWDDKAVDSAQAFKEKHDGDNQA